MSQLPAILLVDDDPGVLAAVSRDLQPRYGDRFRIYRASSGENALATLRQLRLRNDPVALLLVDQRMPGMTGVELLAEAIELYPDVKRILLTAYADTDVAIRAINEVRLDHYLLKPWDPPELNLFPVLDDALDDWLSTYSPPFTGVRVIGNRWSAETYEVKDFLARNLIPYQSLDVEHDDEARTLLEQAQAGSERLPVLVFPDGNTLVQPTLVEVARKIGLRTEVSSPFYDLVIIGAGPAGLAGAVYGASEGLRTLLIERQAPGGQAGSSARIENYLGFPSGLSGADLARRATAQARRLGAEFLSGEVVGIRVDGQYRAIELSSGETVNTHAVLISTGVAYRRLDAPGVERLTGAGVYYGGSVAEARQTAGETVFIVGGANSAGQAAVHFAQYANCVTLLVRGESLAHSGMSKYLEDRINDTPNIQVWRRANVVEALGDGRLEALRVANLDTGSEITVPADDLFIFIGAQPHTDWLMDTVALDGGGYILTGNDVAAAHNGAAPWPLQREPYLLETNVPGVFAAGDIRHRSMKRIASATGEGAMAIHFVHRYLSTL